MSASDERRVTILQRVRDASYDDVPAINSVLEPLHPPLPVQGGRWRGWRARVARKRILRERARHPERFRVAFSDWVAIPWRDRPDEARVADYAQHIAALIERAPAWHDSLSAMSHLRLDPEHEAADIACRAYDLYQFRAAIGDGPSRKRSIGRGNVIDKDALAGSGVTIQAQDSYDEHHRVWEQSFEALGDRLAAFDEYRQRIDELADAARSAQALRRLESPEIRAAIAHLTTSRARDELAAADMDRLAGGA